MKLIHYTNNHHGLASCSPFNRLSAWNDLFEGAFERSYRTSSPPLDLRDSGESLEVRLELAGMKREDFDITLEEDTLTVMGRRDSDTSGVLRDERFTGEFRRMVSLPCAVRGEDATANYQDGILTISLPKTEQSKPRRITVQNN